MSEIKPKKTVQLYTDGACSGNPGPGGWGCILNFNGKTGLPETFEVKDLDFVCRFSDFKFVTK